MPGLKLEDMEFVSLPIQQSREAACELTARLESGPPGLLYTRPAGCAVNHLPADSRLPTPLRCSCPPQNLLHAAVLPILFDTVSALGHLALPAHRSPQSGLPHSNSDTLFIWHLTCTRCSPLGRRENSKKRNCNTVKGKINYCKNRISRWYL